MAKIIPFPGSPGSWSIPSKSDWGLGTHPPSGTGDWEEIVAHSRWWRLGRDILASIPRSGFPLAAGGKLPDALVKQLYSVHIKPWMDRFSGAVGTESDSRDISMVHWMLGDLKLVKNLKGRLTLTRAGQAILEEPAGLFSLFFDLSISGMHWEAAGDRKAGDHIQSLFPSSLALLAEHASQWISCGELIALAESELALSSSIADPGPLWYQTTIQAWAEPLGLVEIRDRKTELRRWNLSDEEVCISPLFSSFLK